MSHEHEALYLAVAALDFELSPDEYARMEAGLAECAECADAVASHQEVARLLERLPTRDASPYVRERVLRAALVPPRQRPQWSLMLVAAALLGLLLAAAFAVGAFKEKGPLDASVVLPSASAPAHGDEALPEPSTSPEPGASDVAQEPAGSSKFGAVLTPDTLAEVVSGRLRDPFAAARGRRLHQVRTAARCRRPAPGRRRTGRRQRLRVVPGDRVATRRPVRLLAGGLGLPWRSRRHAVAPSQRRPVPEWTDHDRAVVALHPEERVACFGDSPAPIASIRDRRGIREPCTVDSDAACIDGPAWLTGNGGWGAEADVNIDTPSLGGPRLAIDPNGLLRGTAMPTGVMVDLEGAFDHPAAQQCRPGVPARGWRRSTLPWPGWSVGPSSWSRA